MTGHSASNIPPDGHVVVVSSAVRPDNPEVLEAHRRKIPVIPRAEMLAELMRMKYGIAIAGTHGKTTTTSMVATVLATAGWDPTAVVGGKLNSLGSNAKLGQGEFLVAEADESDGSFLKLSPTVAVVTNIDPEHLDFYSGIGQIKETFLHFINKVPFYGFSVLCIDHPNVQELIPSVEKTFVTYGFSRSADYRAEEVVASGMTNRFAVFARGERLGEVLLRAPGRHNVSNALAAAAVALELGIPFDQVREGLSAYAGVGRRFQVKGEIDGVTVVDDYGHHPAEVRATLAAAREVWPDRRIVVGFQPHRYSRTRALFKEFLSAFQDADVVLVFDGVLRGGGADRGRHRGSAVLRGRGARTPGSPVSGQVRGSGGGGPRHPATGGHLSDDGGRRCLETGRKPSPAVAAGGAGRLGRSCETSRSRSR